MDGIVGETRYKTMAEYIKREALLKHAHIGMTRVLDTEWQKGYWDGVDDMAEYIREQPAADVAEVVRCKDCKNIGKFGHNFVCCEIGDVVEETFFCSRGARMDGEGE